MNDYVKVKIVVLGDENTGKTKFIEYLKNGYDNINFENYILTTAGSLVERSIIYNDKYYKLEIWDTLGKERYSILNRLFFRDADIIFIFFNYYERKTFERVKCFIDEVKLRCENKNCICVLIGNKYDLNIESKEYNNFVFDEEVLEFANNNSIIYTHISTLEKHSNGINELMIKTFHKFIEINNI